MSSSQKCGMPPPGPGRTAGAGLAAALALSLSAASVHLRAGEGEEPAPQAKRASGDLYSQRVGAANLRLIDLSLDILAAAGWSTEHNASIRELQGGGHDPKRRGFTIQNVELALSGAVDPYFTANANIVLNIDQE